MYYNNNQANIADLIQSGKLWVKNTTNPRMVLLITIIDRAGRTTSTPIPDTPHPIHLSNHVPKDTLETCQDLYRFIQSGALSLVPAEDADAYYKKNPQALQAVRRAFEKVENRSAPISREAIAATDHSNKTTEEPAEKDAVSKLLADVPSNRLDAAGVSLAVKGLVMNVKAKTLSVENAVLDLTNMETSETDLQYILNTAEGHLREVAKTRLADMRA
jgi:hypothetical protein